MKQPPRDELIAKIASLEKQLEHANSVQSGQMKKGNEKDESLRVELSKALGAPERQVRGSNSLYEMQVQVYSWYEIFREIGKLLQRTEEERLKAELERLRFERDELLEKLPRPEAGPECSACRR